jgi:peptidoglycan/LPS O-acetylase OafA/YrhL
LNKVLGFDGLRAIAAISVVLTHLHIFKLVKEKGWLPEAVVNSISAGVQVFFVLSGFLITSLLIAEHRKSGGVSLYNFYIRRSLRIFPLYYLVVFLVLIFHVVGENVTNYKSLAFAGVYSYNFIPKAWYSGVLGHTWSLAVEEHFYLLWPFIYISLAHNYRKLSLLVLTFIGISLFLAISLNNIEWLYSNFFINRWSFIAGANIAFGALLAILFNDKKLGRTVKYLFGHWLTIFISLLFIFNELFTYDLNISISIYLRGIGFTILIGWIVLNQDSKLTRALEIQPLSYLGKVSYGIYMYQGLFLSTGPYRSDGQTWPPDQTTGFILLVLAVPISYHFFEKPIMALKHKFQKNAHGKPNKSSRRITDATAD